MTKPNYSGVVLDRRPKEITQERKEQEVLRQKKTNSVHK